MSKRETEEQFKRLTGERRPFEELRQAVKMKPIPVKIRGTKEEEEAARELKRLLGKAIEDESGADLMYLKMAELAKYLKMHEMAENFRAIAGDELRHKRFVKLAYDSVVI